MFHNIWVGNAPGNYFGEGFDGDLVLSSSLGLVPSVIVNSYDSEAVVKHYRNVTINSGGILTTSQPCRMLWLYILGDLTVNSGGYIDMSARGPYRNPTDVNNLGLRIKRFTYGGTQNNSEKNLLMGAGSDLVSYENRQGPISKGTIFTLQKVGGGASGNGAGQGGDGGVGQTGGGGGGAYSPGFSSGGGSGCAGTCFSGGSGGGGRMGYGTGVNATDFCGDAGYGSGGAPIFNTPYAGAGNPSGGCGGTIVIICKGTITVNGYIYANGSSGYGSGGYNYNAGGGGSGGGNIVALYGKSITGASNIQANYGPGGTCGQQSTGSGRGGYGSIQIANILPF